MPHKLRKVFTFILVLTHLLTFGITAQASIADLPKLDPKNPVELTAWVYYTGPQQQEFEKQVQEFNQTLGAQQGIIIESKSMSNINELTDKVLAAVNREAGAEAIPDFFAAYADTAYQLNKMGHIANISQYLSTEEIGEYIDAYMHEGILDETGAIKIFPIAKATELLILNQTDWEIFSQATGADIAKLSTWEGIVEISEMYYQWTEKQNPKEGGKAFFGRDAFANYLLIGSLQLGTEIFQVTGGQMTLAIDDTVMRKLWDHYYVPYVSGWFGAYGRFRSDDIKTGQIIALVGSTSGALYFPTQVTRDDGTTYDIESTVHPLPNFDGAPPAAVQQGAGMVITKGDPVREYAAAVFLKWFSDSENNIQFSINSGYLPVKKAANNPQILMDIMEQTQTSPSVRRIIENGVEVTSTYRMYASNPFQNAYEARQVLEYSMTDAANAGLTERLRLQQEEGLSYENALKQVITEDAFDTWLLTMKADMAAALAK